MPECAVPTTTTHRVQWVSFYKRLTAMRHFPLCYWPFILVRRSELMELLQSDSIAPQIKADMQRRFAERSRRFMRV